MQAKQTSPRRTASSHQPSTPLRLASYLRVSTDRQVDEDRYGIARQRYDVEQFAARMNGRPPLGHRAKPQSDEPSAAEARPAVGAADSVSAVVGLVVEYVEVTSGANGIERREAFPELLGRLDAGDIDGIVLADLTRLSRRLTTQEALLAAVWARGGVVYTADGHEVAQDDADDPMRTAMRQMAGVFAELDRAMIAKRLRDGRKAKARAVNAAAAADDGGRYAWSFAPFGYRKEGSRLVPDDETPAWEAITLITQRRAAGDTLRAIAAVLNDRHSPTPSGRGTGWTSAQVSRVLARERHSI